MTRSSSFIVSADLAVMLRTAVAAQCTVFNGELEAPSPAQGRVNRRFWLGTAGQDSEEVGHKLGGKSRAEIA
jgi:hypothetical protein